MHRKSNIPGRQTTISAPTEMKQLVTCAVWSEVTFIKNSSGTVYLGTNANKGEAAQPAAGIPYGPLTCGPGTTWYIGADADGEVLAVYLQPLPGDPGA